MAAILTEPRFSVLSFIEETRQYEHRLPYSQQKFIPLNAPLGIIPPFQIIQTAKSDLSTAELVRYDGNIAVDVKSLMLSTGFEVTSYNGTGGYGDYNVWQYPGTVPLPTTGILEGVHYLRLQDTNGKYYFSHFFSFYNGLGKRPDFVKLEWWSYGNRIISRRAETELGGDTVVKSHSHIQYQAPFKWYAYIKAGLYGGDWKYEEEEEKRGEQIFTVSISMYKEWKFAFPAPEHLVDAIAFIKMNDRLDVTYNRKVLTNCVKFLPTPSHLGGGRYGVECTFRTDVTNHFASTVGIETNEYTATCLPDAQYCVAIIPRTSTEYDGGFAIDETGANRNFVDGDLVIVETLGFYNVRQAVGTNTGNYGTVTETDYSNWWTDLDAQPNGVGIAGQFYAFAYTAKLYFAPFRTGESVVGNIISAEGHSFGNSLIEVILKDGSGTEWSGGIFTSEAFRPSNGGISFSGVLGNLGATAYKFVARSWRCPNIAESEWYADIDGVDWDIVEDDLIVYPEDGETSPNPDGDDDEG